MNILRLKYFVDTAETENITRAAQKNYISQTAMSQQISNIENELEVQLFRREKGRIYLTDAGKSFYADAAEILRLYDEAVKKARSKQRELEQSGVIRIGILTSSTVDYFDEILNAFSEKYPGTKVKLIQHSFASLRSGIENGMLDIILCPDYNAAGLKNIRYEVLTREKIGLLVSLKNPLAVKDEVCTAEIMEENIIMTSPEYSGLSFAKMKEARERAGYEARITEICDSAEILRQMVALNRGDAFLPERRAIYDRTTCKMLRISDSEDYCDTVVAWRHIPKDMKIRCLVDVIVGFFRNDYDRWIEDYLQKNQSLYSTYLKMRQ